MTSYPRQFAPEEGDAGASAGKTDNPARSLEHDAAHKRAGDPGSIENAAGMHKNPESGDANAAADKEPQADKDDTAT